MESEMDDEFLYRFRRQPPREFAQRLKARLDRQSAGFFSLRSSSMRGLAVALALGGTALAITTVSMQGGRFALFDRLPSAEIESSTDDGAAASDSTALESRTLSDGATSGGTASPAQGGGNSALTPAPTAPSAVVEPRGGSLRARGPAGASRQQDRSNPAAASGAPRNRIWIVGAADIRPYVEASARNFGSTLQVMGAGEALTVFCADTGPQSPDVLATFDRGLPARSSTCAENRVVEITLGYEAVVLARSVLYGPMPALSPRDVFLALAKEIPNREEDPETLIQNPYRTWNEVNPLLDPDPIVVIYPPEGSAYREDVVLASALDAGCNSFAWIAALKNRDEPRHAQLCRTIREDGVYKENADPISYLETYPTVIGALSYRGYERSRSKVVAMPLGGVEPTLENIRAGTYPASRALYFYVKTAHVAFIPNLRPLVEQYLRYQLFTPLIPSDEAELSEMLARAASLGPAGLP
jgi:phosphate transport system substrate-binding protein